MIFQVCQFATRHQGEDVLFEGLKDQANVQLTQFQTVLIHIHSQIQTGLITYYFV